MTLIVDAVVNVANSIVTLVTGVSTSTGNNNASSTNSKFITSKTIQYYKGCRCDIHTILVSKLRTQCELE